LLDMNTLAGFEQDYEINDRAKQKNKDLAYLQSRLPDRIAKEAIDPYDAFMIRSNGGPIPIETYGDVLEHFGIEKAKIFVKRCGGAVQKEMGSSTTQTIVDILYFLAKEKLPPELDSLEAPEEELRKAFTTIVGKVASTDILNYTGDISRGSAVMAEYQNPRTQNSPKDILLKSVVLQGLVSTHRETLSLAEKLEK
jgi:hypothetical protein